MTLVSKSFSEIVTFSRSSNATRVGPTGLVEYAPHNLLQRSQEFDNAYWSRTDSTITANTIAAPDGTITADTFTSTTAGGGYVYVSQSLSATTYTASVYVKAGTATSYRLDFVTAGFGAGASCTFNLSNGTAGSIVHWGASSGFSAAIVSAGNGWYRCSITGVASAANWFHESALLNAQNQYVYLWGAQLSVGPYALDYTPTTSAAVYGPRFDYDGSGVTIVEPVSRNLLTYSEQFDNAAWSKASVTVSANSVVSPDGTTNADTLIPATNTADHDLYPLIALTATSHTLSIYAKYSGYNLALSVALGGSIWAGCIFDLQNGVAKTPQGSNLSCTANIQNVGNGWYRCSITYTATSASWYQIISATNDVNATMGSYGFISFTGNGTSGLHLWGAQLEVGSTATGYMVSGATNGFRAVPVVSGSATARGLLVEEQRTNLLTYSQDVDNAIWNQIGGTVSANFGVSPDGSTNADKLIINNGALGGYVYRLVTGLSASTVYTQSVYVKQAGFTVANLWSNLSGSYKTLRINLQTGALSQNGSEPFPASYSVVDAGNGWWRVVITETTSGTSGNAFYIDNNGASGNGSNGLLIWGAQLEAGSFATSYIPTLASTVTRSADVASVNTLSPWANLVEGTIYAEFDVIGEKGATNQRVYAFDEATGNDGYYFSKLGTDLYDQVFVGGVGQASLIVSNSSLNTTIKNAFAFKVNDFAASTNGAAAQTDTSGSVATPTRLNLGMRYAADNQLNGHLRRIAYYPRRLTNAELQALTA